MSLRLPDKGIVCIVGLFAFVISNMISCFSVLIVNNIMSSGLFAHIKLVMFRVDTIYILFIVLLWLTFIENIKDETNRFN